VIFDEKFEWGTYRQDLRDFQLVSKRDNPTARAINEASGATKARGKLGVNNVQIAQWCIILQS
jgi:hypothetical protein